MRPSNTCELFRFNNNYCDVFEESDHFLYAECEPFGWPHMLTCKEYKPTENGGFIVSDYCGADLAYLKQLEPAPLDIAEEIIASEEKYTLVHMAHDYGYPIERVLYVYNECIADGETAHEAFTYTAACMMEYDL